MLTPLYLFTQDYAMIVVFFGLQGLFAAGGIFGQNPSYLANAFRPKCARQRAASAITRGRSSVV